MRAAICRRVGTTILAFLVCASLLASTLSLPAESRILGDIEYARVGEYRLQLDLYLPPNTEHPPLIVWVHGGAWRSGSKKDVAIAPLIEKGFAIASVDYRLTSAAPFPANVHDIKAAVRFLRAKASEYGYAAKRIIIAGASAGGHLAALVGVSNGLGQLEGTIGDHLNQSSDIQAIVSFFGASNLQTILGQSTPRALEMRVPALKMLLGGSPEERPELARLASPVVHVDGDDPPLFLIHGDQDPQMPINQSHELHGAYKARGVTVAFEVVHGGHHGGKEFYEARILDLVAQFLHRHGVISLNRD